MEDLLTGGDRFASRTTVTGTHTGDLMGMPATGKRISVEAVDVGSTANGQAQERWGGLSRAARPWLSLYRTAADLLDTNNQMTIRRGSSQRSRMFITEHSVPLNPSAPAAHGWRHSRPDFPPAR